MKVFRHRVLCIASHAAKRAASGIGRATAVALARRNAAVALFDRNAEACHALATELDSPKITPSIVDGGQLVSCGGTAFQLSGAGADAE